MRYITTGLLALLFTANMLCREDVAFQAPSLNRAEEPIAPFSAEKAAEFLDSASLHWQKTHQCFTCHTNYAYLLARPSLGKDAPALKKLRNFAESMIQERWKAKGPRWDAEVVTTASILAMNDAMVTGKLHPLTRQALDQMWKLQRADGGWNWLKCDWPPMESDDHYGATLAAIGVGMAPDQYSQTPAAQAGMTRLKTYFTEQQAKFPHHRGMLLWADAKSTGLVAPEDKTVWIKELLSLQKEDGGWNSPSLGTWKRHDGKPQDFNTSDGYATGFVIYVLRQAGLPVNHSQIQRGVAWLKSHQRESGRWYARSLFRDGKHYLSHAASAFAVMALAECKALGDSNTQDASNTQGREELFVAKPLTVKKSFTEGIEGPACDASGNLYVVNYQKLGDIVRITPDGKAEVWIQLPHGSVGNGIVFDKQGLMYVADYKGHHVMRIAPTTKIITKLVHEPAMNQPNDLAIAADGTIYASDPNWKESTGQLWKVSREGSAQKVASNMGSTNGIDVSPDGRTLYVNESVQRNVWAFPVQADGTLGEKRLVKQFPDHGFDGMRCDIDGNLYITRYGKGTVVKMSPEGTILKEIDVLGKKPSNICFGGPDGRTAYVTEVEHCRMVTFRVDRPGLAWQRLQGARSR